MSRYVKALTALIGALATWGITAAEDGVYSQGELWGLLLALVTAAGVYQLPNRPPRGRRADPAVSEQGHADLSSVLAVAVGVLLILVLLRVLGLL